MADLDRAIAEAERGFERIRHDAVEDELYDRFKEHWNAYRTIVNQMLAFSRDNRRAQARAIYGSTSRAAYDAASDTLGHLTDRPSSMRRWRATACGSPIGRRSGSSCSAW